MNKLFQIFNRIKKSTGVGKRRYEAAKSSRLYNDWSSYSYSANYDIKQDLKALRARARELCQNDPYAINCLRLIKTNLVGPNGFILRNKALADIQPNNGRLQYDKLANRLIQEAWLKWCKVKNCTSSQDISFREAQNLIIASIARDGEFIVRKIRNKDVNQFGFTLQLIEPDYLDESYNDVLANGNVVIMGVEINSSRKPVRYHFRKANPELEVYTMNAGSERISYPAEEIIHLFIKERAGQVRGVSWFAPAAVRLKMLMGFEEASLVNARASACKTGVLKPSATASPDFTGNDKDSNGNIINSIEAGETYVVPWGYDFTPYDPKYPTEQHEPFTKTILRGIASAFGFGYNQLANNYSEANYSSLRASFLVERDNWKVLQSWFSEHLLDNIFESWLDMALLKSAINLPYSKFEKFNQPWWIGKRWDWVDPLKDIDADIKAWEYNIKTLEEIIGERGGDLEETLDQIQYEKEELIRRKINPTGTQNGNKQNTGTEASKSDDAAENADRTNGRTHTGILSVIRNNG